MEHVTYFKKLLVREFEDTVYNNHIRNNAHIHVTYNDVTELFLVAADIEGRDYHVEVQKRVTMFLSLFDIMDAAKSVIANLIGVINAPLRGKNKMRKWTDSEIAEAKRIIAEVYANCGYRMTCAHGVDVTEHAYLSVVGYRNEHYEALCCPTDEPNQYIGLMVALSKASGREIPKWVYTNGTDVIPEPTTIPIGCW